MNLFIITGISVGLALDAFTVALTSSTVIKDLHVRHGLRMALFFGFFQFIMPLIGWFAGTSFSSYIESYDHWIAFGLLAFVGGRMIWSGLPFAEGREEDGTCSDEDIKDCRHLPTLCLLSIATSIDALAVGLSFAVIKVDIILPAVIIGVITFFLSIAGYYLGRWVGSRIKIELELFGGLILIGIGIKILIQHLF